MNQLSLQQAAGVEVVRAANRQPKVDVERLPLRGRFQVEHVRDGKVIGTYDFPNGITNEGKNLLLDVMFHGTSAITTWYLGLISLSSFSALAAGDTYSSHSGWIEFTNYTDNANASSTTTRPQWTEGAASGQSTTNSSVVIFDITGSGTVKGVYLVGGTNAQTKSDVTATVNKLWATALFTGGDVAVLNGDQLKVTYTVSA
jgi:hypothetical protein